MSVTLAVGETKTCTLTNNDVAPTLHVIKHVINDNGGTNVAADWSIHLKSGANEVTGSPQAGSETGTTYSVNAGSFTASETGAPSGYHFDGFSGDCNSSGVVTVAVGENKTCTLTNNDIAATVKVIKHVINDNGGTNVAADWSIHLQNSTPAEVSGSPAAGSETGTTYTVPAGTYTASETGAPSGYHFDGFSGDCNSSGVVTVAVGENKTCTLTNNDIAPTVKVIKHVINDNGGTNVAADWSIHLQNSTPAEVERVAGCGFGDRDDVHGSVRVRTPRRRRVRRRVTTSMASPVTATALEWSRWRSVRTRRAR